tara:strand:+ start:283 stop:693 length:411 start_codon:yes stop_codon:yes gene_type:complete
MSWFGDNLDKIKIGLEGEEIIREYFIEKKVPFMQVDIMFKSKNKWYCGEIKSQEIYLSPPFDGHGLPQWQIDRRMEFYKDTGVVPVFIVYDLKEKCVFMQKLDVLNDLTEEDDVFRTKGAKPRTIFNIKHFERIEI